jgi:hypothetical protein
VKGIIPKWFETPSNPRVTYNDDLHKYAIDGITVPSVTNVCYGNVDDYMFGKRGAFSIAAAFGSAVHACCDDINRNLTPRIEEHIARYRLNPTVDHPEIVAHLDQYKAMLLDNKYTVVGSEILLYSILRRVCGRTDGILKDAKGQYWIFDVKTGQLDPRAPLQMGGYAMMAEELFGIKFKGGVIFKLDGKKTVPKPYVYSDKHNINVFVCKLVSLHWDISNMGMKL